MTRIKGHRNPPACRTSLLTAAVLAALPGLSTQAAERLETINVTATRTARTADETLASVTVITRRDIETSQALDLPQLLAGLPGITMTSNGGYGKTTSLHLRGSNSSQVLVLIDGVRIGSASLGTTAWEHLPIAQIERIEVVRGPQSHLYGSDAIGGVVQIFTRKGSGGERARLDGEIGYGTYNTLNGNLGVSGGGDASSYSLRFAGFSSDGFDAADDNNPDLDGYRQTSLSGNLSHRFANGLDIQLTGMRSEGNTEYDGFDRTRSYDTDFVQQVINGRLRFSPASWWDLSVTAGESRDKSRNHVDHGLDSVFETRIPQASWQNDFMVGDDGILTAGLDFLQDRVDGSTEYSETTRNNTGLFAQYQGDFGRSNFNAGIRYDDNEQFGGHTTGNIAWGYGLTDTLRLVASYGTAFKAPTFNDLYYQDPWGSSGNPDLDPEKSKSYELGLEGAPAWGSWSLRAYRTDIDDLIQWTQIAPWIWQPQNIASARIDGLEAALTTELSGWIVSGSLTLLDPKDRDSGNLLPSRSRQTFRLDVDRRFGASGVGATVRASSYSYDDPDNLVRISGFGLVDLRMDHYLTPDWAVRGKISNLFDKDYQTRAGYNEPGIELFLSIVYQPR